MDPSASILTANSKVEDERARHSKRFKIKQLNSIPLGQIQYHLLLVAILNSVLRKCKTRFIFEETYRSH